MNYMKVVDSSNPKMIITIYAEIDKKFEIRKIEIANEKLLGFAGSDIEFHETTLLKEPLFSISELTAIPNMEAHEIDKKEFEDLWEQVMAIALA